ncbi:MAG: ATP phosphoribosyltransferase [Clostridia bacterium]|nr:ATP phosphoribosyltransferase [Clostridia bacterium]
MLRLALTKGRLEQKTVERLAASGIDISPLQEKGRKLIVRLGEEYEVVFAKAADVVTYVEHGSADVGVVGKDTLLEMGRSVYELLDLGFGKCRFAVAALKGYDPYAGYGVKTVATKYPTVARRFFESKNMDVEIVKIEGSVELAPILRLADAIVDIVETGTTLKENGLEVVETVADISARLIVNVASFKLNKQEVELLASRLNGAKEGVKTDGGI